MDALSKHYASIEFSAALRSFLNILSDLTINLPSGRPTSVLDTVVKRQFSAATAIERSSVLQ